MLTQAQQFVREYEINEKFELLREFKEGKLSEDEVIKIIETRRVNWIKNNIEELKLVYGELPPPSSGS